MITRNFWGQIEPRIGSYVVKKRHNGSYEIVKEGDCIVTNALLYDAVLMWNDIEPFDSMVKAYAWLKKHVDELL